MGDMVGGGTVNGHFSTSQQTTPSFLQINNNIRNQVVLVYSRDNAAFEIKVWNHERISISVSQSVSSSCLYFLRVF